jgi:hypothetical protein
VADESILLVLSRRVGPPPAVVERGGLGGATSDPDTDDPAPMVTVDAFEGLRSAERGPWRLAYPGLRRAGRSAPLSRRARGSLW